MKYVVIFLAVVVAGMGFVSLVDWLVADPPPHVMHVRIRPLPKKP